MNMNKYKVWYIPQVPMKPFEKEVDDLDTAILLYETIVNFSIFEFKNKVKPDYSDAGGIQFFDGDCNDWSDLENLDGYEDWEDNIKYNNNAIIK